MDDKKTKKDKQDKPVKELEDKLKDFEDQLKRAVADYRNLEKRFEEEKKEVIKFANKDLLAHLLPAFDNLFLAEKYVQDEGLKLSIKKLSEVFEEVGVKRVKTVGEEFDPHLMECVDTKEGEENKVIDELRPGFMLYDRVLRPAQVRVGKKMDEHKEEVSNDTVTENETEQL